MARKRRRLNERAGEPGDAAAAIAASFAIGGFVDPLQLTTYATTPISVGSAAAAGEGAAAEAQETETES